MKKRMHKLAAAAAAVMLLNAIPVTAFAAENETPSVPKYTLDKETFQKIAVENQPVSIKFTEPTETAEEIGAAGDGVSVYIDSFTDDSDTVQNTLYICADAENQAVYAPADSSELFAKMGDVSELDCTGLDTSNVTDMSYMFQYCGDKYTSAAPLNSLDLSSFDTSKVTNMSHMFEYCNIDGDLNILNFDLSNVTDMTDMFDGFKAENVYCYPRERFRYDADRDMQGAYFAAPTDEYMICYNDYCTFSSKHHSEITKIKFIEPPVKSETDAVVGNKVYAQWEDETGTVYIYSDSPDKKVYASYDDFPFAQLEKLVEIDFTNFDTSKCQAFGNMFFECKNLKTIDLSGFDTRNAVEMYGMFVELPSLESLDVSSFDTSNVTEMTYMFDGLPVSEIDVSGFDTSKVTNMSGMFEDCFNLTSLDLSSFDLSKVKKMDNMFRGTHLSTICCSKADYERYVNEGGLSLSTKRVDKLPVVSEKNAVLDKTIMKKAIQDTGADVVKFVSAKPEAELTETVLNEDGGVIGGFDAETKTLYIYAAEGGKVIAPADSSEMFRSLYDIDEIDCSALDTSNVTNMKEMFSDCHVSGILDIHTFDLSKVTNMESMFGCSEIGHLCCYPKEAKVYRLNGALEAYDADSTFAPTDEYMIGTLEWLSFMQEHPVRKIAFTEPQTISEDNIAVGDKVYAQLDEKTSTAYVYSDSPDDKVYAPYGCYSLFTSSTLEEIDFTNFDTGKCQALSSMFYQCSALKSLDLSGFDTGNAVEFYAMFYECSALETVDLSSFDTSNVTDMMAMFEGCKALTTLDLSGFETSNVTNMEYMFAGCASLTSLDVSSFDTSNVTSMRSMFENCQKLTALDVSSFDTSNVKVMRNMFSGCEGLTSLNVSSFDTSNVIDMRNMFSGCKGLTSLNVSSFDTSNVSYMSSMFNSCYDLTSLDLSSFDLSKVKEMDDMFRGTSLSTICCSEADYERYVNEGGLSLSTKLLAPAVSVSLRGDANCDEIVDISDAILVARYAAEDTTVSLTEIGKQNADVTGDNKLTAEDTAYIIRMIAKLV